MCSLTEDGEIWKITDPNGVNDSVHMIKIWKSVSNIAYNYKWICTTKIVAFKHFRLLKSEDSIPEFNDKQ